MTLRRLSCSSFSCSFVFGTLLRKLLVEEGEIGGPFLWPRSLLRRRDKSLGLESTVMGSLAKEDLLFRFALDG